jgi:hypothetical protein
MIGLVVNNKSGTVGPTRGMKSARVDVNIAGVIWFHHRPLQMDCPKSRY